MNWLIIKEVCIYGKKSNENNIKKIIKKNINLF
jgi:hypothetical protein